MKTLLTLLASTLVAGSLLATTPQKPNIVLIFADDLGWKDVGYQGSDFMECGLTDKLAAAGPEKLAVSIARKLGRLLAEF